jgi:hypothetical protein
VPILRLLHKDRPYTFVFDAQKTEAPQFVPKLRNDNELFLFRFPLGYTLAIAMPTFRSLPKYDGRGRRVPLPLIMRRAVSDGSVRFQHELAFGLAGMYFATNDAPFGLGKNDYVHAGSRLTSIS